MDLILSDQKRPGRARRLSELTARLMTPVGQSHQAFPATKTECSQTREVPASHADSFIRPSARPALLSLEIAYGSDLILLQILAERRELRDVELWEGWNHMAYQRITVELLVFADEADSVVTELNSAIDRLEETHTIFGGGIENVSIRHSGVRRKSALRHTLAAGHTATSAVKLAAHKVADAYKKVI